MSRPSAMLPQSSSESAFFSKNGLFSVILLKKADSFLLKKADLLELWGNIAEGLDMLEEHKRPFLETSECCAFIQKSFKALRAVFLIFFHDWKLAYNSAIKCLCLDFCAPLYSQGSILKFNLLFRICFIAKVYRSIC